MPIMAGRSLWRPNDGRRRDHVPATPRWIGAVRLLQFAFAIALVPVTAHASSEGYRMKSAGADGYRLSWVASAWTCCYVAWFLGVLVYAPRLYSLWAHL